MDGGKVWLGDPLTRRAVFGLFGLSAIAAACASDEASPASTASTTPASAAPTTSSPSISTSTSVTPTSVATTTAPPSTTSPESVPATTSPASSVLPGSNAYLSSDVLTADSEAYGGSWTGAWALDDGSGSGSMTADVVIDVTGRTITGRLTVDGPLIGAPVPPIDVVLPVDSFVYSGDDGTFDLGFPTAAGAWRMTSDGGFGKFRLHIDLAVGDAVSFDATGVANRPSLIPVAFTITASGGSIRSGTIQFTPG